MNNFIFIWRNISFKPLGAVFHSLLLGLGVAMILTVSHLGSQLDGRLHKDLAGIDLVVSGKGSPLQIILASVFHMDTPTGNIAASELTTLKASPFVKAAIPLALGDNFNGFRIVGTTPEYIAHYHGQLAQGVMFDHVMEVVVGSDVAAQHQIHIGDQIAGAHGLVNSTDVHSDTPYKVVGILKETGTVLDRLVLTPVGSVWHVHEHPDEHDHEEDHESDDGKDITAVLITYRTPLAAAQLPRLINDNSSMQAASPAVEVARLNKVFGVGRDIMGYIGWGIVLFAAAGFFVAVMQSVHDRRYDLAILRVMGASRARVMSLVLAESFALGACGALVGIILSYAAGVLISFIIYHDKHIKLDPLALSSLDLSVMMGAVLLAGVAGIVPAWRAGQLNIAQTLAKGI